jgi:hypothetical protein
MSMVGFQKMLYGILNKPYFEVIVTRNRIKIKKFIQVAAKNTDDEFYFLICKELKCAWFKPELPIIDGMGFLTIVDINNAIPLQFVETDKIIAGDYIIKEQKIIKIIKDEKKNSGSGMPLELVEIPYPPVYLYQQIEAHFITKIQSMIQAGISQKTLIWILLIAGGALLLFMFMSGNLRLPF